MSAPTIAQVFLIVSVVLFGMGGIGSPLTPNAMSWGLFFLSLSLLIGGRP